MSETATVDEDVRALLPAMSEARERFLQLVDGLRPELHRYCARMMGSVFDGEDIVQETFAKAYYALGQLLEPPNLRPWLFRIAHNTALDALKRLDRRHVEPVAELPERAEPEDPGVDPELVEAALAVFVDLPPLQRSALILKDVLGHSLDETAATMNTTVGAVKAALFRARANVARTSSNPGPRSHVPPAEVRATLQRYATLFNAHDWSGLKALLAEEAQLDIVSRLRHRAATAGYYERYATIVAGEDLRAEAGLVDGIPALAVFRPRESPSPAYFIRLETSGERVSRIRDFRYIPYIARDARYAAFR